MIVGGMEGGRTLLLHERDANGQPRRVGAGTAETGGGGTDKQLPRHHERRRCCSAAHRSERLHV